MSRETELEFYGRTQYIRGQTVATTKLIRTLDVLLRHPELFRIHVDDNTRKRLSDIMQIKVQELQRRSIVDY